MRYFEFRWGHPAVWQSFDGCAECAVFVPFVDTVNLMCLSVNLVELNWVQFVVVFVFVLKWTWCSLKSKAVASLR